MGKNEPTPNREIQVRQVSIGLRQDILGQSRTRHQRFSPDQSPNPAWTNYTTQRHIRQMAIDSHRHCLWLATWGGVLCWQPEANEITRFTSEHGLFGNATRAITVDQAGVVWAAGQEIGLCTLAPDAEIGWQPFTPLKTWTFLCLAPHPDRGIYAALRDPDGRHALYYLASPEADWQSVAVSDLVVRNIATLHVDSEGTLWTGNAWGLHNNQDQTIPLKDRAYVRALATALAGGLWVGTNRGLYHFQAGQEQVESQAEDWPQDEIVSLAVDPQANELWVVTSRQVGHLKDKAWRPLKRIPPYRLNDLLTANGIGAGKIWLGGAQGLYQIETERLEMALTFSPEDELSNAIQALGLDEQSLWVGTAKGLYRYEFQGQTWTDYSADVPDALRDVRAICPVQTNDQVWIGSWRDGLSSFMYGWYLPEPSAPFRPIVALAATVDGTLWAATLDNVYWRQPGQQRWELVPASAPGGVVGRPPDTLNIGIIQTICPQMSPLGVNLWVGTSNGLFCYPPDHLWIPASERGAPPELNTVSIQALVLDRHKHLWIGTTQGVYCQNKWQQYWADDVANVQALALAPQDVLWIGTATGLQARLLPRSGTADTIVPLKDFTIVNSGLAANAITTLAVRVVDGICQIWIGSMTGLSCYSYPVT